MKVKFTTLSEDTADFGFIAEWGLRTAKYVQRDKDSFQFIGVPFAREELESRGARFNLSREPVFINEHVVTTGETPIY